MKIQSLASILYIFASLPCTLLVAQNPKEDVSPPSLRVLEIDDTFKIRHVGHPEFSPDGRWVAYTVRTRNFEENSSKTRIWMIATEDGEPIPMTAEAVSSRAPKFSRDGERLYFLSARNGGILTNYIITQTDRFKGAVSGAGSALYLANYGHDMYQRWYESELGLPWENRELWNRLSPFNHIQNVSTPTLFACGEKDWNVPVQNSEQLYQALRRRGITTQLVVYPGEHHGGWTCPHEKDFLERRLAWYDQYVKGESPMYR